MRGIPDLAAVYIGFLIGFGVEGAPTPVCLISATQLEDYGTRRILMLLVRWQTQGGVFRASGFKAFRVAPFKDLWGP